jgi:DNA-binding PadR family transcriptional regulator
VRTGIGVTPSFARYYFATSLLLYDLETRGIIKPIIKGKSKIYLPTEAGKKYIEEKLKDFYAVYTHILGLEK